MSKRNLTKSDFFRFAEVIGPIPLLKSLFSSVVDRLSSTFHLEKWAIYLALYALSIAAFEYFYSRYIAWRLRRKSIFTHEERGREEFREQVSEYIKSSKTIYFLILSGFTMAYDERETFLIKMLRSLSPEELQNKDIRVLMLHPESDNFRRRADYFVKEMEKNMDPARVKDVGEYKAKCEGTLDILRSLGAKVRFYSFEPHWRLQIFDDAIFFSFYSLAKGGHLTSLYRFTKDDKDSIYYGFQKYFLWMWNWAYERLAEWPETTQCKCGAVVPLVSDRKARR